MMNNNHKKSGCGFEEELVSYIYGECDAGAKAKFEQHLAGCSLCADELEAFSGVHFAIGDWKTSEFNALETPAIEIPYPPAERKVPVIRESWLPALLRDLFSSFSPRAFGLATACVAVLAVAVGTVLLVLKSPRGSDVAETNKNTRPAAVVPTIEKTPEPANVNQNISPQSEPKPPQNTPPEIAKQPDTKNSRAVKVADKQRPAQKSESASTPKPSDPKRSNKSNPVQAREIPDEDEDDTLRLAELFEEIGTRD